MSADQPKRRFWPAYVCGAATMLAAVVLGQGLLATSANAQIPDSGAQRYAMIKELEKANKKLAEIADVLREIRDGKSGAAERPMPATVDRSKPATRE